MSYLLITSILFLHLHTLVLIEQLGDGRFIVREAATQTLVEMVRQDGAFILLPLLEQALRHPDLEVARRAGFVHEEYFNVWPPFADRIPWLDMLPETSADRQAVLDRYLPRARAVLGPGGAPEWAEYRLATAYYLHDCMRAGLSRSQAIRLLDQMYVNEQRYLARR
jgi:hypothetical protein